MSRIGVKRSRIGEKTLCCVALVVVAAMAASRDVSSIAMYRSHDNAATAVTESAAMKKLPRWTLTKCEIRIVANQSDIEWTRRTTRRRTTRRMMMTTNESPVSESGGDSCAPLKWRKMTSGMSGIVTKMKRSMRLQSAGRKTSRISKRRTLTKATMQTRRHTEAERVLGRWARARPPA